MILRDDKNHIDHNTLQKSKVCSTPIIYYMNIQNVSYFRPAGNVQPAAECKRALINLAQKAEFVACMM